jgi:hypothetical protein
MYHRQQRTVAGSAGGKPPLLGFIVLDAGNCEQARIAENRGRQFKGDTVLSPWQPLMAGKFGYSLTPSTAAAKREFEDWPEARPGSRY